jgi:hypothetical protein
MKLKPDNKTGMIICNRLMVKPLREKEREFVSSVMRQIMARPESFQLSEKQARWLQDIWRREAGKDGG